MMRWIVYGLAAIAIAALLVAVVGAMLPRKHVVSRTVRVAMPPDRLYALLSDVSHYQAWRPDVKSLQRLPDKQGRPAWIEESGGMKIPMTFERMEPSSLLISRIDTDALPFGGAWTYRIAPADAGSELTITENGELGNVIFRFMSRFVFGHYATMDAFLKNLARHAASRS